LLPGVAGAPAALRADRNIQACLDQHASLAIGTPATQSTSTASLPIAKR
jgi:hypothetical protein